jgi:hypothetical protein
MQSEEKELSFESIASKRINKGFSTTQERWIF